MQDKINKWEQILSLTDEMLIAANTENWDSVVKLEKERQELIHAYFTIDKVPKESYYLADYIMKMLDADKKLVSTLENQMHEIQIKVREISLGQQAIMAYTDT